MIPFWITDHLADLMQILVVGAVVGISLLRTVLGVRCHL